MLSRSLSEELRRKSQQEGRKYLLECALKEFSKHLERFRYEWRRLGGRLERQISCRHRSRLLVIDVFGTRLVGLFFDGVTV